MSFSIGYPKEEIKRLRFNISEYESLTSVIKDGIKCLRGQNEDAEKKAYELRQQLDELKGIFVRICPRSVKRHTVKMEVLMCTSMHSQP